MRVYACMHACTHKHGGPTNQPTVALAKGVGKHGRDRPVHKLLIPGARSINHIIHPYSSVDVNERAGLRQMRARTYALMHARTHSCTHAPTHARIRTAIPPLLTCDDGGISSIHPILVARKTLALGHHQHSKSGDAFVMCADTRTTTCSNGTTAPRHRV